MALVTPVHAELAFDAEDREREAACDWSALYFAPMLGLPSIVLPAGSTRDGMPSGLMITAAAGQDQTLLQIAAAYEAATQFGLRRPPLIADSVTD